MRVNARRSINANPIKRRVLTDNYLGITLKGRAICTHSFSPDNYREKKEFKQLTTIPYAKVA